MATGELSQRFDEEDDMSIVGVAAEQSAEARVAATPETVKKILALGYEVLVEKGAGAKAAFPDSAYQEAGSRHG
jgi:NAD(P) transhydrogenase subunit alpha